MANNTQPIQEPQSVLIDKNSEYGVQESLVLSILSQVTLTFKGFDFDAQKFRLIWIDQATQDSKDEVLTLTIKNITEPNPDYNNNLPESPTNKPNITYEVGEYIFTETWLKDFFDNNFNGRSANFNIEIFHLNAAFKVVVDYTIATSLLDNTIVTPIQGLVPLPFNNPFADIGIRGAVPQETPQGSDELSWKSGYTEPYQRPTNRDGKWIKMGQYNQILYDISKSALILQDNLSILAKYITDEVDIKLSDIKDKVEIELAKPPKDAVLLKGNQNVAGLKNFTGVNANNFKTTPTAVANLEWCNGMPLKTTFRGVTALAINTNITITLKSAMVFGSFFCSKGFYLNNRLLCETFVVCSGSLNNGVSVFGLNRDTYKIAATTKGNGNSYSLLGY